MDLSIARWTQDIKNRKHTESYAELNEDNVNNNEVYMYYCRLPKKTFN